LLLRRWFANGFDRGLFLRFAAAANLRWLFAAWLCGILSYLLRALRWRLMIARMHPGHRFWPVVSGTVIGYTGTILIGRAAEFLRPVLIARFEGLTVASQLAVWLVERIYDTLLLFTLFGLALLVTLHPTAGPGGPFAVFVWRIGGWLAAAICSLCLIVLVGLHFYPGHIEDAVDAAERRCPGRIGCTFSRFARRALEGIHSVRGAASVVGLLLLSIGEWIVVVCVYLAVFQAFPATAHLGFADACVFTGMVGIGAFFQIPGIGGGVQIAAIAALTEFFGIGVAQAGLVALAAWAAAFVGIMPFGLVAGLAHGLSLKRLVRLSREEVEGP
jgi:hypothetical protein